MLGRLVRDRQQVEVHHERDADPDQRLLVLGVLAGAQLRPDASHLAGNRLKPLTGRLAGSTVGPGGGQALGRQDGPRPSPRAGCLRQQQLLLQRPRRSPAG